MRKDAVLERRTMPKATDRKARTASKARLHDRIVETLGRRIVCGEIEPGASLGNETTTGETLNASRTATREALKILGSKGLIESRPRVGTIVREREAWSLLDPKVLEWSLQDPSQSSRTMAEIYVFRMAFEPFAAALAAANRTEADLKNIRRALRGMATYVDSSDRAEFDLAFHKAILRATGNKLFFAVDELISVALRHIFRTGFEATPEEDERWLHRHRAVADAIENGDAEGARDLMLGLLNEAQDNEAERRRRARDESRRQREARDDAGRSG